MSTKYQIIYWRDIPAQLKIRAGEKRFARSLSARFQEAIDRAAMLIQATDTDQYLEPWRTSDWTEREGEPEAVADAIAAELETAYPLERLQSLELRGGHESRDEAKETL